MLRQATSPSGEDGYILVDGELSPNASVARLWGPTRRTCWRCAGYALSYLLGEGVGCTVSWDVQ